MKLGRSASCGRFFSLRNCHRTPNSDRSGWPLLLSLMATTSDTADVTLTTLEWPPYTSPSLPEGGATTSIVRQAFENIGIEADVVFLP